MKLDHLRPNTVRGVDLSLVSCDEERDATAHVAQGRHKMRQPVFIACNVQTAFGRPLFAFFWHDTNGVWFVTQGDLLHLLRRGHFEVQRDGERLYQSFNICVGDMAAILPQVRSDAIGSSLLRLLRRADRIRHRTTARVPHRGHVINVHTKSQRCHRFSPLRFGKE